MRFPRILHEYLKNSTLHGARFIVDEDASLVEKLFWIGCVLASWFSSSMLISASLDAFENNAISFVSDTSYSNWETNFPAIVVCELKNMDRIQEIADELWGSDHDFTLEEVLSEIAFFRGESYHTVHECGDNELATTNCFSSNFSYYAKLVRSSCEETISLCTWNETPFDCCQYFAQMETELGICYALNSLQTGPVAKKLNMNSNRVTGPGSLILQILTEANIYILGEEEVPNLVTPKADILTVGPYVSYSRYISKRDIQNDEQARSTSVQQRNCRFHDENILTVHKYYSYSACIVQCRRDKQMRLCNCTNHLMPNTDDWLHCNMTGLECLNEYYEDLSVVVAKWSNGRKGLVCDCLPSCTEVDISTVHDNKENIYGHHNPISKVLISLMELPTERYKRIVTRGKLDLVVSMGGTTGLFVGASLLSFVEIFYYFVIRSCTAILANRRTYI